MARALRVEYAWALYHVMNRGVARMRVYLEDEDRRDFLERLGWLVAEGNVQVHAFCLMPNHYHLLCTTPEGELSRWMQAVNGGYGQGFNRRHRRVGPVWQGRFRAILVEKGSYMLECSRYVHLNPNRAKLTCPAERWKWSSYRNYVGGPAVVDWVTTGPILRRFGGSRKKYRAYVEAGKGEKEVSPFERAVAGVVLGGESFVGGVLKRLRGVEAKADQPSLETLRRRGKAAPERVEEEVERLFAGATKRRRGRMRLYALARFSRLRASEVARRCGRTPGAVTAARQEVDAQAEEDALLARRIGEFQRRIQGDERIQQN